MVSVVLHAFVGIAAPTAKVAIAIELVKAPAGLLDWKWVCIEPWVLIQWRLERAEV